MNRTTPLILCADGPCQGVVIDDPDAGPQICVHGHLYRDTGRERPEVRANPRTGKRRLYRLYTTIPRRRNDLM